MPKASSSSFRVYEYFFVSLLVVEVFIPELSSPELPVPIPILRSPFTFIEVNFVNSYSI